MQVRKGQWPILIVNVIAVLIFSVLFWRQGNFEFIIYVGVIIFFLILIAATNSRIYYPNIVLWALTVWAFLHMAGGGIFIGGTKLYEIMLVRFSDDIFRYDQFVHIVGFAAATVTMFYVLKPLLRPDLNRYWALYIIVVMAGLGLGALNEIIEFFNSVILPETGVGGYLNTSLDLAADLIGAILAMVVVRYAERDFFAKKGREPRNERRG